MNYAKPKQILHGFELPHSDPLTIGQVAKVLTVSSPAIHNLIQSGELDAINISAHSKCKMWRISRASLVDLIKRRTTGPTGDFQALEAPHGLDLPPGKLLGVPAVSGFLRCSFPHTLSLIGKGEIRATNVARSETRNTRYRIARSSLIEFINRRTEGAP